MSEQNNHASSLQQAYLSLIPLRHEYPHVKSYAHVSPSIQTGRYFFETFPHGSKTLIVSGTLCKEGIFSVILTAKILAAIKAVLPYNNDPSELAEILHQEIAYSNPQNIAVSLFLGLIDHELGEMTYTIAGEFNAMTVSSSSKTVSLLPQTGAPPIGGILSDVAIAQTHLLSSHDLLILIATPLSGVAITALISALANQTPDQEQVEAILKNTLSSVQSDLAFSLNRWIPPQPIIISNQLKVHFQNELAEINKLHKVVELFAKANHLSKKIQLDTNLILEELLTNTISYGYQDHANHAIHVEFKLENGILSIQTEDDGVSFNPLNAPELDLEDSLEDRSIGGLGIHFVRSLTQSLNYERKDNLNVLHMTIQCESAE